MAKKGFHQTGKVIAREIIANPNPVAINAPEGFLLEWWNIFNEILSSSFLEVALLAAESFNKVEQTVDAIVPKINPENSTYVPNHIVPKCKPLVRDDKLIKHDVVGTYEPPNGVYMVTRIGVSYLSERESPSNFGNNRSLQQASHQGWPSVDNVAVQTLDMLKLPAPASSGDFFSMLTQADSSGKDAGMLGDRNQRTSENLPADQQIMAPIGGIMKISGKQPAVPSSRKRKTLLSSVASIGKEKATVAGIAKDNTKSYFPQGDAGLASASNSIYALRKRADFNLITCTEQFCQK
ncbi:uncharacterized protein LOC132621804 [Lycium barbarum]|uniref:uncharacterized protein LOC132621804 n=1 Tax=Lycium barbarum TaxID=112863 RepID=UPI00293ED5B2|nr:uncharacterized protein LOC132621804 [Lycium barbarum]XP_060192213.1 uncharacterized protein LOC132621804 [Lycium barbarum]XP_060192214.1 uncharacterized protein LOC132621804 [Lycium barbarum]XP_060192215.1 uncharacterized protein LOC132621804 [Lycium barbarum]